MYNKEYKFIARYKKRGKRKQVTFTATNRAMALLGLFALEGIEMKNIISLKKIK